MNWEIFHPVPEEHQPRSRLYREPQFLFNLVHPDIASKQQQIFVRLQLQDKKLKEFHQLLRNRVCFVIEEHYDILAGAHFLLIVVPSQFVRLLSLLSLPIQLQLMLLRLDYELPESLLGVRRFGDIDSIVFLINRNDILLVMDSNRPQGRFVLIVVPLSRNN